MRVPFRHTTGSVQPTSVVAHLDPVAIDPGFHRFGAANLLSSIACRTSLKFIALAPVNL